MSFHVRPKTQISVHIHIGRSLPSWEYLFSSHRCHNNNNIYSWIYHGRNVCVYVRARVSVLFIAVVCREKLTRSCHVIFTTILFGPFLVGRFSNCNWVGFVMVLMFFFIEKKCVINEKYIDLFYRIE